MTLPELPIQFVYGRLAWGVVLAAVLVAAWPASRRLPRRALAAILGAVAVLMLLPGERSPAWHLTLACQYPSGLLVGLCLLKLHARWSRAGGSKDLRGQHPAPVLPPVAAAVLTLTGALLYLDAFGLLAGGYYYAGFGPLGAPLCAVLAGFACVLAVLRGRAAPQACAVLGALALFSLARLPSGNLWDAVLDPLLWAWAVFTVGAYALQALLRRRASLALQRQPALAAAGVVPFSPIKE